jgi:hypothetical protein
LSIKQVVFSIIFFVCFKKNEIVETIVLSFKIYLIFFLLKYNSISCENRANQRYLNPIRYDLVLIYLKIATLWLKLYNFLLQNDFNTIKYKVFPRFYIKGKDKNILGNDEEDESSLLFWFIECTSTYHLHLVILNRHVSMFD